MKQLHQPGNNADAQTTPPTFPPVRQFFVYILASKSRRLYVGVTNDLVRRVYEHRTGERSFTAKYRITRLVYYEVGRDIMAAIAREKRLKKLYRAEKLALIARDNAAWDDLAERWFE
jgi:putative endonuclease